MLLRSRSVVDHLACYQNVGGSIPPTVISHTGESPVNKSFKEKEHEEHFNYLEGAGH